MSTKLVMTNPELFGFDSVEILTEPTTGKAELMVKPDRLFQSHLLFKAPKNVKAYLAKECRFPGQKGRAKWKEVKHE